MTDQTRTACRTCVTPIAWIDCPTGGWWAHDEHPVDEHDAVPAAWVDGDPLMEAVASEVWERCSRDDKDMPQLVCDDPRNIAAVAAAVARAHQPAGQAPATDQTAEVARLHDELLASKAEIAKLRALLGKENQRANDAITREETTEQAAEEAQQEARRLGLMVDEYGAGASALTDKLRRARERHRETCILARGEVKPTAFRCGLCEVLDAPAAPLRRMADEAQQPEACGRTVSVHGQEYPPCARPPGHREAYCRSADGRSHFISVVAAPPAVEAQQPKEARS